MQINRLWTAMLTRESGNSDTDSSNVAAVLARRLDGTNQALIELTRQAHAGVPRNVSGKPVEKVEASLGADGASLVYAGYPYDPFAPNALEN
jgi:hypothetical protein